MPTNQQRRDAAKRKLERQLVRRQERLRSRRRRGIIASVVVGALVIGGAIWLITTRNSAADTASSANESSAGATTPAAPTTPCAYTPTTQPTAKAVDAPTNLNPARVGTVDVTINLGQGPVTATLNRALAPCAVNAFLSLASQKFYDDTPCHRLTSLVNFKILQCGDPSGTGRGGPGYEYKNESTEIEQANVGTLTSSAPTTDSAAPATTTETPSAVGTTSADTTPATDTATSDTASATETTPNHYPLGTIAMAATAPSATNGSQFFIIYGDTTIDSDAYTKIGTVSTAGISLIEQIAAKGSVANADGISDKPAEAVQITSVVVPGDAVSAEAPPSTPSAEPTLPTDLVPTETVPTTAVETDTSSAPDASTSSAESPADSTAPETTG